MHLHIEDVLLELVMRWYKIYANCLFRDQYCTCLFPWAHDDLWLPLLCLTACCFWVADDEIDNGRICPSGKLSYASSCRFLYFFSVANHCSQLTVMCRGRPHLARFFGHGWWISPEEVGHGRRLKVDESLVDEAWRLGEVATHWDSTTPWSSHLSDSSEPLASQRQLSSLVPVEMEDMLVVN